MKSSSENCSQQATPEWAATLAAELRAFVTLCGEILALAQRESQALAGRETYCPADFDQHRRQLLPSLEEGLTKLRHRREFWQQCKQHARACSADLKSLLTEIQNLLMRVLLLDRENQQAMLRRGLIPAPHVPSAAAQQPHFVAGLYQRHVRT